MKNIENIYIEQLGGCFDVRIISKDDFSRLKLRYICSLDERFDEGWEGDTLSVYEGKKDGKMYGIYDKDL